MTNKEVIRYYKTCKEHYPISDDFVRKYQQNKGESSTSGYIKNAKNAKNAGIEIDAEKAEPNQKWHLLTSYYSIYKQIDKKEELYEKNVKEYCGIKCPELVLWMAEAAGCDVEKVQKAAREAGDICKLGAGKRVSAAAKIKDIIPWEDVEKKIKENSK